ncbi:hypothetical protein BTA51_19085 [Hahella sp. CCB-MM4]|uniref:hypothetical protein n=1 Tax=Hahella sp. (strain CCB-MM4) TaxID=1926491 RepID=UPI000B9A5CBF|nr:hypothetical protein [Hahella sp. CCB-MM4]OZG71746.1 hypothetical protein BTA51_19085 [Hahella sp. CCB-MM4]
MARSLIKPMLFVMLLPIGYLAGQAGFTNIFNSPETGVHRPDYVVRQSPTPMVSDLSANTPVERPDREAVDIRRLLSDADREVRLQALFWVWRHQLKEQYEHEIDFLTADSDSQIKSLALWVLGKEHRVESTASSSPGTALAPHTTPAIESEDPDEQVRQLLVEDDYNFQQVNEQIGNEQDLLEPLYQLEAKQQQEYIEGLVVSEEDAAVLALNELIVDPDPKLQKAAIDGLLAKLEMRTGHYSLISQMLEKNVVFLNDDQREKLGEITQ